MDRNPLQRLGLALVFAAGLAALLAAQRPLHSVRGVVKDTEGVAVPGVEIVLESPRRSTTTGADGRFAIDSVPQGRRRLLVRRIGYLAVNPLVTVPQLPGDTLRVTLLQLPQQLAPILVEVERQGVYGVVGDTGYHALPGTLVEVLGARIADTTDERGRFAFPDLKEHRQYVLRVSRVGYLARLISIDLGNRGQDYSVFLTEYRPGASDWANSAKAMHALADLATRLATEPRRNRMTRAELQRYGTMALCDIPRVRSIAGDEPEVILRGNIWLRQMNLCNFTADQIDLLEWGADPCREAWQSISGAMNVSCAPQRFRRPGGMTPSRRNGYVVIWPRD